MDALLGEMLRAYMFQQAWKTHKLVCKATPTAQPPSDTEKSSLVDLGCAKIPSDMSETQGCVRYLQNQQGDVLKV